MSYSKQMSSAEPGLILIMVDQSHSMLDYYIKQPTPETKSDFASMAVNKVINEIVTANADGIKIKDRCFIAVIGYGATVELLQVGMLEELANNPVKIEKLKKKVSDGAGGIIEIDYEMPIWVTSKANNGTPMDLAFSEATKVVSEWVKNNPNSAAPIIINITDGMPNNSANTEAEAKQLMNLSTSDGNVLIFNAHISDESLGKDILPNDGNSLKSQYAQFLFNISSEIPLSMFPAAQASGFQPQTGARGIVANADADTLVRLLNFGSSGATSSGERYS